ncbi:MAG: hypothetical protein K9H61_13515 [Bacteroidia bacterium]|nr:hypothetical protein [Bacteroidia bacterium]MCF8426363.1 hypothetical protein [Bacteroidia bacterium]MCF8448002.1 hypothetical protein [Bacteroidia bacterium]
MGAEIHIRLTSDRYNDKALAPYLGRDFHSEITRGAIWHDRQFLSDFETELLEAPYDELFENKDEILPIEPRNLEKIMIKVRDFLYENQDTLPFEIEIDYEKMENEKLSYNLTINNCRCWIQGDSRYYQVTDKVKIVNYPFEPSDVDLWIGISDRVELEGKVYYLKMVTRFERYKELIDKVIDFCRYANKIGDRIYWTYSH